MDLTRDVLRIINSEGIENLGLVDEVYNFYNTMQESSGKDSWGYHPRARKGKNDGHKTTRRLVWKRDYFGELYRDFEDNE